MSDIVIFGSSGFIGRSIGHSIRSIGIDRVQGDGTNLILDINEISNKWLEENVSSHSTMIFAIGLADVRGSLKNPIADYDNFVRPLKKLLLGMTKFQKMILISSSAVYSGQLPDKMGFEETQILSSSSIYGLHRIEAEMLVQDHFNSRPRDFLILRPFSVFGEGLRRQVIYDLYNKIVNAKQDVIEIFGTGNESRDFVHVEILNKLVGEFCSGRVRDNVLNVCTGQDTSVRSLSEMILKIQKKDLKIKFTGDISYPLHLKGSTERLSKYLDPAKFSLDSCLLKTVNAIAPI